MAYPGAKANRKKNQHSIYNAQPQIMNVQQNKVYTQATHAPNVYVQPMTNVQYAQPIVVQQQPVVYAQSQPGQVQNVVIEPEKHQPIYVQQKQPIYVQQPKQHYIQKQQPIYVQQSGSKYQQMKSQYVQSGGQPQQIVQPQTQHVQQNNIYGKAPPPQYAQHAQNNIYQSNIYGQKMQQAPPPAYQHNYAQQEGLAPPPPAYNPNQNQNATIHASNAQEFAPSAPPVESLYPNLNDTSDKFFQQ
eukprot:21057_1